MPTGPRLPLLFVYGSLKEGFPNFHVNKGRRVAGDYRTAQAHPFFLVGGRLPCLMLPAGRGHRVAGQLFEVDAPALAAMDRLERVGEPGGYRRAVIEVEPIGAGLGAQRVDAFVYVQDESLLTATGRHIGPLAEYTQEHAKALRW